MKKLLLTCLLLTISILANAKGEWWTEAEDASSTVTTKDGVTTIIAPKGLTLWNKNKMTGNTIIEYDARIVSDPQFRNDKGEIRISDLNCFWMADKCGGYGGKFANNYALKMYYMGYGGNWNTTTRFRRYTGYAPTVEEEWLKPIILREYTDADHLIKADHWYHIRLEAIDGRVRYIIDGECLVDYIDPHPLKSGYFGFRTTLAHAEMKNFTYSCVNPDNGGITLKWIGGKGQGAVTFGVPFDQGEINGRNNAFMLKTDKGESINFETRTLASWPDGSCKWQAFTAVIPQDVDSCVLSVDFDYSQRRPQARRLRSQRHPHQNKVGKGICDVEGIIPPFSVTLNHKTSPIRKHIIERQGYISTVHKYTGDNFIIRAYTYRGSRQVTFVHTLLVDSTLNKEGLNELSIHFKVPMHGEAYERYVQFDDRTPMSVQPLIARRPIDMERKDPNTLHALRHIAKWDGFRLSQLSPNGYSIRKRATSLNPWIGTIEGTRSNGRMEIGDSTSATVFRLKDFWQSYPSTLQVDNARGDSATVTVSLYSPEAEAYSFAHYDTIAHSLESSYEDVQPGMSIAWGIARTSTLYINPDSDEESILLPTPAYLHRKRAFGIWSLPVRENSRDSLVEGTLDGIMDFYEREIERNGWYGFFNYGDVMHGYDASRDQWRYDVGGYAWDNTELASPSMFWYQFLRTADRRIWRMAEAMTRHCSEVDTYHAGPHAGLGSRHNVVHWGCGAKESRISEAWWNRFMYYLTADERLGDIMHEVADADTLLYTLDPMRLAQPREKYPCSAPARLRIGPDWVGYASNWLTEWERTGNLKYRDKLLAGMNSIVSLPNHFFQGPMALGYDPSTGIISTDMPDEQTTNHLMPIMGGFELINELQLSIDNPQFFYLWRIHNSQYKEKAFEIKRNKFRIPRLQAYAAWQGNAPTAKAAWASLLGNLPLAPKPTLWTNDCATWTMDAIFMQETLRNWK
ncbi:MAG: DUF1080 domain-containing protein [Prevotella sp.]|nr:DUF1080 domain-containing protein [Prevotella sp.]